MGRVVCPSTRTERKIRQLLQKLLQIEKASRLISLEQNMTNQATASHGSTQRI